MTDHAADDRQPAWSPDGSTTAFVSDRDGSDDIDLLDVASGRVTRLTDHPTPDRMPAWSPDGERPVLVRIH